MTTEKARIRIELTSKQQKQIKDAAGQQVSAIEFTVDELEKRITPLAQLRGMGPLTGQMNTG